MKKILFLSSKDICYSSTDYFEKRISDELINAGMHVTHIKFQRLLIWLTPY